MEVGRFGSMGGGKFGSFEGLMFFCLALSYFFEFKPVPG